MASKTPRTRFMDACRLAVYKPGRAGYHWHHANPGGCGGVVDSYLAHHPMPRVRWSPGKKRHYLAQVDAEDFRAWHNARAVMMLLPAASHRRMHKRRICRTGRGWLIRGDGSRVLAEAICP